MAELKDRMMDDNFGIHSTAPMVNALEGGQMGPLVNQGKYIQNAHYIKTVSYTHLTLPTTTSV